MNSYLDVLFNYKSMIRYSRRLHTVRKQPLLDKLMEWEDLYYYNVYYKRWG